MRLKLLVAREVETDLDESAEYLGRTNRRVADRFLAAVDDAFETLRENPGLGATRGFRAPQLRDLRTWRVRGFENWLVFYRVTDKAVEILRVLHGARDLRGLFDTESAKE